jgi:hypothetical protein
MVGHSTCSETLADEQRKVLIGRGRSQVPSPDPPSTMPFTLLNDENYRKTQQELAALGPQAVAIIRRYLAGAPASEIPAPMIAAAYDVLDRLGLSRHSFPVFAPDEGAAAEGAGNRAV